MGSDLNQGISFVDVTEATARVISPKNRVVTVIGNEAIRSTFEPAAVQQILNIADAPGIIEAVLNPDGHVGYGCPVGSVFSSAEMIYPNAVGPDVKCSMSFLQFNIPAEALADKRLREELVRAIEQRIPNGPGNHMPAKARPFNDLGLLKRVAIEGATPGVLKGLNIPEGWAERCEDATHGEPEALEGRLQMLMAHVPVMQAKLRQLGGVGGGNHFLECNRVDVMAGQEEIARAFGLVDGNVGFLCHFGSRGFGFALTLGCKSWDGQFRLLSDKFQKWGIPFPGGDAHNVYVPVGTPEARDYWNDMSLGANFATVNHLLVCTYVMEAFEEVLGGSVRAELVYYIAHNIIRQEIVDDRTVYVHRKGATRAYPAGHFAMKGTPFYETGHPILLPGNPIEGSTIMVGKAGSRLALNSVNHGAGRVMSRRKASQMFSQKEVNSHFERADIVTNCGEHYPVDECAKAYKPYGEVIASVEQAGLAALVARLRPVIIKDNDTRAETSA